MPTVMVVDDDAELRDTVCELLAEEGYRILGAASGGAALARLRDGGPRPDLILLDLMMPGMSGWEFRDEQLRDADLCTVPVVVFTAGRSLGDHPIHVDEVLYKPLKLDELLEVVRRFCGPPGPA